MPKGPERTPCARWMYCGGRELSGEQFRLLRGVVRSFVPWDEKGYLAFRLRFCEYEYITSSIMFLA
jgi:hypothetical protein